jgi:outer membrane lipoprotein-sorting protein
MSLRRRFALLTVIPLVLASCGGSSEDGDQDRAAQSPQEILADVRGALEGVDSYRFDATLVDKDGPGRVRGDVAAPGSLRLKLEQNGTSAQLVATESQVYMNADRAFWDAQGGGLPDQVVDLLSGRWVKVPADGNDEMRDLVNQFLPKNLAYCLSSETGTVTKGSTATVAGQETVVLRDKGDKPGTAPGELYVAATGAALPLRVRQTGPAKPGGSPDPRCSDGENDTKSGDIRLSRFDEDVSIKPPPDALDLAELGSGGQTTTS